MPRSSGRRISPYLGPYHRKKREEARRKRESQNNLAVQNRKGSSTSDIAGHPNDGILERISANCANCASPFESDSERNVKFKTMLSQTNEIEIIDAIFYIYGLTVADWSKTLTIIDHGSDFTSASEVVSSNGIPFCSKCSSALENVYTSHKSLKEIEHNESLFAKALNNKYSREIQNKSECEDNNELIKSLNNSKLSDEELEFKEEESSADTFNIFDLEDATLDVNSELEQMDDPLRVDGLDDLQSSNNVFTETNKNSIVEHNENIVSIPDDQRKTNSRFIPKILQRHQHPKNAKRSIKNAKFSTVSKKPKKEISLSGVPQIRRCSAPTSKTLPLPKLIIDRVDHSFNISCCDESFFNLEEFINHQLNLHKEEMPKLIKCNICEVLIPKNRLANHMENYNEFRKQYFKCKICASKFLCASGMTEHLQTHDSVKYTALICDICETPTQSDYQLIVHKMTIHSDSGMPEPKQVFTCNICNSKFKTKSGLRTHCYTRHDPAKQVTCGVCGKLFSSKQYLHTHMKRMHLDTLDYKYPCTICNKMFGSQHFLAAHQAKSTVCQFPEHCSVCEKCGKSVLTSDMYKHKQLHEDEECSNKELFRCPKCGKLLNHRDSLQKHTGRECQLNWF